MAKVLTFVPQAEVQMIEDICFKVKVPARLLHSSERKRKSMKVKSYLISHTYSTVRVLSVIMLIRCFLMCQIQRNVVFLGGIAN